LKKHDMKNLLYAFAAILIVAWAIGFFVYHSASIIHLLLVNAVLLILICIMPGEERFSDN